MHNIFGQRNNTIEEQSDSIEEEKSKATQKFR